MKVKHYQRIDYSRIFEGFFVALGVIVLVGACSCAVYAILEDHKWTCPQGQVRVSSGGDYYCIQGTPAIYEEDK